MIVALAIMASWSPAICLPRWMRRHSNSRMSLWPLGRHPRSAMSDHDDGSACGCCHPNLGDVNRRGRRLVRPVAGQLCSTCAPTSFYLERNGLIRVRHGHVPRFVPVEQLPDLVFRSARTIRDIVMWVITCPSGPPFDRWLSPL